MQWWFIHIYNLFRRWLAQGWTSGIYASLGRFRLWVRSPVTTDNFSCLFFVTLLIRGTIKKFRGHRVFNPESYSPKSPVSTTAVHCHKMTREMVVYKSVWTQRHKKYQRSDISTTGLRSRISEGPRAFAGFAFSDCHFLVFVFFLNHCLLNLVHFDSCKKENYCTFSIFPV